MVTPVQLRNIREAYVAEQDLSVMPSIPELCRQFDAEDEASIKYVRRACARENWEAKRRVRANKLSNVLAKKEDEMIERIATEMIKKREELLRNAVDEIEDLLPLGLEELRARIESGFFDDKALVAAVKLLMDSRKHVIDTIQAEFHHQDDQKNKAMDRDLTLLRDLGLLAKVADAIEHKFTDTTVDDPTYQAVDASEQEALKILDAEVVGEG